MSDISRGNLQRLTHRHTCLHLQSGQFHILGGLLVVASMGSKLTKRRVAAEIRTCACAGYY